MFIDQILSKRDISLMEKHNKAPDIINVLFSHPIFALFYDWL
jgi:hypothetical protein